MKSIVIFRLPDNKLFCKDLAKLSGGPVPGRFYLLNGQEYEAVEVVEPLVSGGGYTQILELMKREFGNEVDAATALTGMVNLDAKLEKPKLGDEPDSVVLVRCRVKGSKTKSTGKAGTIQLGDMSFNLDVKSLLAGPAIGKPTTGRGSRRRRS